MNDRELIQKVYGGNKDALDIMVDRYYADIFRFCLYMVQTEEDAYDITQETFLKFIKYGTSGQYRNLKGYLLMIARNLCFTYFREKSERPAACEEEPDSIPCAKDKIKEVEAAVYLGGLLRALSPEVREVVILRIYEEMKFKEIAQIMGCNISTAKSRFRLGTGQLKRLMENDYDGK